MKLSSLARSCLALTLIFFAASALAEDSFSGTWKISDARTLAGKAYTGTVRIASMGGPVYELQWNTSAGKYRGLGLADGNKLCTGWSEGDFGVMLYKIKGDGTLKGRWTIPGANELEGTEEATGGPIGVLPGDYELKGTNPGGKGGYEGKLRIRKSGATYQLRWTVRGGQPYYGVGLKVGDALHVAWGTGRTPLSSPTPSMAREPRACGRLVLPIAPRRRL